MTENGPSATAAAAASTTTTPAATTGPIASEKRSSQTLKPAVARRFSNAFTVPTVRPVMRYMPTYRLEPKVPLNREICEKIIKGVMDKMFDNFVYTAKHSQNIIAHVCEEIKNRVKMQNFDRYRYICVISIGEKCMQGYTSIVNFLWDADRDGYISYVHDTPDFFAIATLYYLYYD